MAALRRAGLHREALGGGLHAVECPWAGEHGDTDAAPATYEEPTANHPLGRFRCGHDHADRADTAKLLAHLEVEEASARCLPRIQLVPGDTHRAAAASERVLARDGSLFRAGSAIVRLKRDPATGAVSTEWVNDQTLAAKLASMVQWEKHDGPTSKLKRCDVPRDVVGILMRSQDVHLIPELTGIARQPFFRPDGSLVTQPGFDRETGTFAAFEAGEFVLPELTWDAAREALQLLVSLLKEFGFASPEDLGAALGAMLTAALRPSLRLAPAFNITAHAIGSGKSHAGLVALFAGPGAPHSVSYPATQEEATKSFSRSY